MQNGITFAEKTRHIRKPSSEGRRLVLELHGVVENISVLWVWL
jgi:hypothetical protein